MTTKPVDPLVQIEHAQKILAKGDASLAQLESARRELDHVIAAGEAETAEIADRRTIEMSALTPAGELDKALDSLDRREKQVARRVEIASTVRAQLVAKIDVARGEEAEAKRQTAYAAARKLHDEATNRIREFCDRVGPEAAEVLRSYAAAEAATSAANKDLPAGAAPIMSIEARRQGSPPAPRITERHFKAFTCGRDYVAEVGAVEATPAAGGTWTLYLPSASVQGGSTVGGCVITDMVDLRIEKFESRRVESLATALRAPPFYATAPERGTVERKRMRLSEWRQINGEPVEAEVPLPRIAAE